MLRLLITLVILTALCVSAYLFTGLGKFVGYALEQRLLTLGCIVVVGVSIGVCTLIFQTITNNKILTPSIIGLDSLYILVQSALVYVLGVMSLSVYNSEANFLLSLVFMVLFTLLFYYFVFKNTKNIYFIMLLGIIFGTFFSSLSMFFEVLIDPDEFLVVQGRMFASFNNVKIELLTLAFIIMCLSFIAMAKFFKYLDILALGRDLALDLGLEYDKLVRFFLIIIAILTATATALVGPITFLGLLVANITYELCKTYKHLPLCLVCALISIISLVGGAFIIQHVFKFNTTISVIINFIGGIYFIYLVLKRQKI